jgi:hypothetical protein
LENQEYFIKRNCQKVQPGKKTGEKRGEMAGKYSEEDY